MILADVSQLPDRHKRELLRGERVQAELDILEQKRLKAATDRLEFCHIDGLGARRVVITRNMAARVRLIYGTGCFHDNKFVHQLLRDNPMFRVNCRPAKTTIRVDGSRDSGRLEKHNQESRKAVGEQGRGYGAQGELAPPSAAVRQPRQIVLGHETPAPPLLLSSFPDSSPQPAGVSSLRSPVTRHSSLVTSSPCAQ